MAANTAFVMSNLTRERQIEGLEAGFPDLGGFGPIRQIPLLTSGPPLRKWLLIIKCSPPGRTLILPLGIGHDAEFGGRFSRRVVFGFALPCFAVTKRPLTAPRQLPRVNPLLPGASFTVMRGRDISWNFATWRPGFALMFPD